MFAEGVGGGFDVWEEVWAVEGVGWEWLVLATHKEGSGGRQAKRVENAR